MLASIEACMPKMEALVEGIYCGTETCYEVLDVSHFSCSYIKGQVTPDDPK